MRLPVIVVGAGPVGLVTAIQLLRTGVPVRLIDKKEGIEPLSKALVINAATLELFEDLEIIEPFLDEGRPNSFVRLYWKGRLLQAIHLGGVPSRYPYFLALPQCRTETILRKAFRALGGQIENSTQLVALAPSKAHVRVTTKTSQGHVQTANYVYVVGADGGRSTVRTLCGIGFHGKVYESLYFIMCDAPLEGPYEDDLHYFVDEDIYLFTVSLAQGIRRVVILVRGLFERNRTWQLAEFQAYIAKMRLPLILGKPVWVSSAPFYDRLATTFRRGRVFLAGDAAHLFSPVGGQGMNIGVQDGYNLAWKLSMVWRGVAGASLLDSYGAERLQVAQAVRTFADMNTRLITRQDRDQEGPLRLYLESGTPYLEKELPGRLMGTEMSLRSTPTPGSASLPREIVKTGYRLPDCFAPNAAFHDPSGQRSVLVCFVEADSFKQIEAIQRLARTYRAVLRVTYVAADTRLLRASLRGEARLFSDHKGQLRDAFGMQAGNMFLVRPDRFVAWKGRSEDRAGLVRYLALFYISRAAHR